MPLDYPMVSVSGHTAGGLPLTDGFQASNCPVCNATWTAYSTVSKGKGTNLRGDKLLPITDPYIAYRCGGVWRQSALWPGYWGGRCGNRSLLRQARLVFMEDEDG